ncbi:zn 2cys6 transcription factor [Colletotrichum truncatum]|uniref:Zn 2cys6 transcription factor n=1 Tax=Colletotrichum truncatum TaxID=5467 RepID=A0ACC3YFP1_COLTU
MCDVKTVADELPSEDEAQALFESFRDQNLKYFPFLHFKKTVTSKELREERPFLWLCIITVTTRLPKQQIAWGQRVRQAVAQKLINENEKNIEYFLGLLIILSWPSHYLGDRSFTSLMCQIAKALYFDLGLYTEPLASSSPLFRWKTAQENGGKVKTLFQDPFPKSQLPRTMEQRRAIVACYVITSIISDVIEKNDALRWSPHMNECLTILDEQSEVPSDRILAALTRIQLLSEEARSHTLQLNVSFDEFNNLRTPASTYARLLQDRLQCIIRNLPPELQSADIIISQIHYTELVIQEIALPTRNKVDSSASLPDIARLNSLYMCLHYIKAWFGHFYTIPPAAYYAISYPFFARLRLCFTSLYRLSILEDPVWDRMSARNTIDLITTLDEVGDRFMRAGNGAGSKSEVGVGNGFAKAAESISVLKELCEIALAPLDTSMDPAAALSCVASTDMLDTVALPPPPPPPPLAGGAGEVKGYQLGMNPTDWRWSTDPFTSFDF